MKVASVVGARPQFIKITPVSRKLRQYHKEVLIHTGQHYDKEMSNIFFTELELPSPDYNIGIGSGTHGQQTGRMLIEIEKILMKEKPDCVLVYGDTNSTLSGALAASKLHIPIAHVEAGLRSFDKSMPEEINRVITDHISDILFAPTKTAVLNLKNEGIEKGVYLVGDVMLDAIQINMPIAEQKSYILKKFDLNKGNYIFVTIHRASNTDNRDNLLNIINALKEVDERIILPLHPRTKKCLKQYKLDIVHNNITVIDPVGYLDSLILIKNAKIVLTDSGGIQKEAYILKVPCITLRTNTEWIETVEYGWNLLVGPNKKKIIEAINNFNPENTTYRNIFGDGNAAGKICEILESQI